jgi:hypothetical protein
MDHAETIAKRVLEVILPGASLEYQPAQSHGEYDFELRYHNGTIAAVEVTSSVDQIQAQTIAAIRSKKKGGPVIQATKCKGSWMIFPAKDAKINEIRGRIDGYLSKLEQARIEKFSCIRGGLQCVQDLCYDLKIVSGSVISTGASPKICIASPGGGGAVGPSIAIEAGRKEAWKQDNREKLGAAKTDERHLVVYIDIINGLPWVALTDSEPTSTLPNLPEEITCIWLVSHAEKANEFVVWHASIKEPWCSMRVVCPRPPLAVRTRSSPVRILN